MIQLIAWRRTGKNPSGEGFHKPSVSFSIGPLKTPGVFLDHWIPPWVMDAEAAIAIFGAEVVKQIGEEPVPIKLLLEIETQDASHLL